ncbi:MAG: hypothetical protein AB8F34_04720 [Akkermansiaceae bacterium]
MHAANNIENDLFTCLNAGELSDDAFSEVALRIFKHQYSNNPAYGNYCDALGVSPESITEWQEIPALPTDAFKFPETPVVSFPHSRTTRTFLTSGTTTERKGAHHFQSLKLYETSVRQMWQTLNIGKTSSAIFLTPSPDRAPQSSLSHMMGVLEPLVAEQSSWIHTDQGLDIEILTKLASAGKSIALFGTALSFLELFDRLDKHLELSHGSYAMETGGYKGSHRQLEKSELYSLFDQKLGLNENDVLNEYSMTELSSQFYSRGLGKTHDSPAWTRIRVIDPSTGIDAAKGFPGYLAIYDLANFQSVMAIQTQDIAIAHDDRSFTLLGRDPSALPRGCSRSADAQYASS